MHHKQKDSHVVTGGTVVLVAWITSFLSLHHFHFYSPCTMLQPKRRAICRLAKIFILRNVLLCYLTNLSIVLRIQHPRILGSHWLWAVYTRSCSVLFSEISLTWHGTCLLLYDNLCLEVHYHPLFSTFSFVISLSSIFSPLSEIIVAGFIFLFLFLGHSD